MSRNQKKKIRQINNFNNLICNAIIWIEIKSKWVLDENFIVFKYLTPK